MPPHNSQRLELTWFNKDKALIPAERGKYGYAWVDPRDPRYCEVHTLVEAGIVEGVQADKDEDTHYSPLADLSPTTGNLLIHGDSGNVLEALRFTPELADEYAGKTRLVFCDAPFNTSKTFTHYEDNLEHSIWLTMMRDRLIHIREILSHDGSVWIHLDDSENHRMRVLMDEVFGPANHVASLTWQRRTDRDNRSTFSDIQDFILVYVKGEPAKWKNARNLLPRAGSDLYSNPDNDPRGPWTSGDFTAQGGRGTATQFYTLTTPSGNSFDPPAGRCWLYTEARFQELVADNRVWFGADGGNIPRIKRFLSEVQDGLVPKTMWFADEVGTTGDAKREIQALFPDIDPFDTPKPEKLMERIIQIGTNPGDIVMDIFAGSGSTAAVAHKMGRRWVTCELLKDNFETFTRPRLAKVVKGDDPGGITTTESGRIDATEHGLPEDLTAEDAFTATQSLRKIGEHITAPVDLSKVVNKLIRDDAGGDKPSLDSADATTLRRLIRELTNKGEIKPDLLPEVSTAARRELKTKKRPPVVNWRGGGSFRVMELSPAVFDFDPQLELVMLTDAASGETLVASIASNLGFERTPDAHPFHGRKGQMRLVVMEGAVTEQVVDDVLAHLPSDERVTIAALSVPDGIRKHLRQRSRGSVIKHVPDDLFSFAGNTSTATIEG